MSQEGRLSSVPGDDSLEGKTVFDISRIAINLEVSGKFPPFLSIDKKKF